MYICRLYYISRALCRVFCILKLQQRPALLPSVDGLAVFSKEDLKGPSHAVQLGVFVDEALSFVDSHGMPLDRCV